MKIYVRLSVLVGFLCGLMAFAQVDHSWQSQIPYEPDPSWTRAQVKEYNQQYKAAIEARSIELGVFSTTPNGPGSVITRPAQLPGRIPGTSITYHSGTVAAGGTTSQMLGNQFNSALNPAATAILPIEASGSITMVTFDMVAVSGTVFLSLYHNLAGTTAQQITTNSIPAATGLNTYTITGTTANAYSGGTFLGGIWVFGGDSLGLATGTVGGQGFHAVDMNDGNPGNNFATIASANAAFSASGNLTTPVELMNFEIE